MIQDFMLRPVVVYLVRFQSEQISILIVTFLIIYPCQVFVSDSGLLYFQRLRQIFLGFLITSHTHIVVADVRQEDGTKVLAIRFDEVIQIGNLHVCIVSGTVRLSHKGKCLGYFRICIAYRTPSAYPQGIAEGFLFVVQRQLIVSCPLVYERQGIVHLTFQPVAPRLFHLFLSQFQCLYRLLPILLVHVLIGQIVITVGQPFLVARPFVIADGLVNQRV